MTDEVGELVLEDNRAQTLALTIARRQAGPMVDVHARYLRSLEAEGLLNRALEFLPTDKQLAERASAGLGLTTPEFAVLLAYTKETNADVVLRSDLPDDPYVQRELVRYFPTALQERFASTMSGHRLRREIVATVLTNQMVNWAGTSFDFRMTDETGAGVADITRAHVVAADVHGLARWWERIDHLDSRHRRGRPVRAVPGSAAHGGAGGALAAPASPSTARSRRPRWPPSARGSRSWPAACERWCTARWAPPCPTRSRTPSPPASPPTWPRPGRPGR